MRLFGCTLLVAFVATAANATPTKPTVADQIRHPGQQVAYGNCQTTCQYNQWTHQTVCQQHYF
jgi:hypothetical protein